MATKDREPTRAVGRDTIRSRLIALRDRTGPFLRHPLRQIRETQTFEKTAEFFRNVRHDLTGTDLTTSDGRPLPMKERLARVIQRIDFAALAEKSRKTFLAGGRGAIWGKFVTIALCAWLVVKHAVLDRSLVLTLTRPP